VAKFLIACNPGTMFNNPSLQFPLQSPIFSFQASPSLLDHPTLLHVPPHLHVLHENFYNFEADCIGDFNHLFPDSQEYDFEARNYSCKDLEEDEFNERL